MKMIAYRAEYSNTLTRLYRQYCRELEPYNTILQGQTDKDIDSYLGYYLDNSDTIMLIECGGVICSFCIFDCDADFVYIHEFFVLPEFRGKWIAEKIIKRIVGNRKEIGLFVLNRNERAKGFWMKMYRKYGYDCKSMNDKEGKEYRCRLK